MNTIRADKGSFKRISALMLPINKGSIQKGGLVVYEKTTKSCGISARVYTKYQYTKKCITNVLGESFTLQPHFYYNVG